MINWGGIGNIAWKWKGYDMKRCPLLLCSVFVFTSFFSAGNQEPDHLYEILTETAGYCEKFASASLNYVCIEDIEETIYKPYRKASGDMPRFSRTRRNHYIYDYQLVLEKNAFKEQRILIEENRRKVRISNAALKTERFNYSNIVLGPLIMSWESQALHDYRIVGEEKFDGTPCVILEVIPKSGTTGKHLTGKVWVGKEDYGIRKLEWNPESIDNPELYEKKAAQLKARPRLKFILELAFEKNGLRFPSRFIQSEEYQNLQGQILICSEATVSFRNYKFFTVETSVDM
jgi:hypothetical protein